ncbi:class II aldolase/adducin family protein [Pelagibacterium luteolum]|uniref:L-fuculose-phosphate aldolase n=1 Tax=Pelagibacterium luteolum TaxID=440168 RepID=A0A1G7SZC3_9HYPH|nr:class II aldolase/adducin family protein [Pelagibacterium luteolum]SDG27680.1 L-fuculose-phosphate aldolase [Pelagibacterium luteolum]
MSAVDQGRLAEQIAAGTRMLVMEGILDYSGHISARVPGTDHVMIQSASDSRAELDPARILTVDMDGNVVRGDLKPPLELALHLEILRARPDVEAVLHCHMELAIAFTLMKGVTLQPMRARASRWASGIPTHPFPSLIRTTEQAQDLAKTLGEHHAALIRSHGMVLVAESVPGLFVDAVHFLENANQHMMVLQAGQEPLPLTDEEIAIISGPRDFHIAKLWNYYVRQGQSKGLIPEDWNTTV